MEYTGWCINDFNAGCVSSRRMPVNDAVINPAPLAGAQRPRGTDIPLSSLHSTSET